MVVRFRFRSEMARIPAAVDRIMQVVEGSGCVLDREIEVELALREALSNAIAHGNRADPETWVHVRCECDPHSGVSIVVRDEGRGFDPRLVPAERGRGLLIMRSCMDDLSFAKNGSETHLRKNPVLAPIKSSQPRPSQPILLLAAASYFRTLAHAQGSAT